MRHLTLGPVFGTILAALGAVLLFDFYSAVPVYAAWDMDQPLLVDLIAIRSHLVPNVINHPSMGLYFLLHITHFVAGAFQGVSLMKFWDMEASPNPFPAILELLQFFRLHSPAVVFVLAFSLSSGCLFWLKRFRLLAIGLATLYLCTESSFLYQSTVMRSELYALLFWSLTFPLFYLITRRDSVKNSTRLIMFLIGMLLCLAFLTKIQIFFHLFLPFALYFSFPSREELPNDRNRYVLNSILIIVLLCFFVLACNLDTSKNYATYADAVGYSINPAGIVLFALFGTCFFIRLFSRRLQKHFGSLMGLSWVLEFLSYGAFVALMFHFLFPLGFSKAFEYLLADFQVAFLRNVANSNSSGTFFRLVNPNKIVDTLRFIWAFYPISTAVLVVSVLYAFMRSKLSARFSLFFGCGLLYFVLNLAIRENYWRDHIWVVVLAWPIFCFSFQLLPSFKSLTKESLLIFLLVMGVGGNLYNYSLNKKNAAVYFNLYGFRKEYVLRRSHFGSQVIFEKVLNWKYGKWKNGDKKRFCALNYGYQNEKMREIATDLLPSAKLNSLSTSLMCQDFGIEFGDTRRVISSFPKEDKGSLIVGLQKLPIDNLTFVSDAFALSSELDWPYGAKIRRTSDKADSKAVPVITRMDVDIFLVASSDVVENMDSVSRENVHKTNKVVILRDNFGEEKSQNLDVYKIEKFVRVPQEKGTAFVYFKDKEISSTLPELEEIVEW